MSWNTTVERFVNNNEDGCQTNTKAVLAMKGKINKKLKLLVSSYLICESMLFSLLKSFEFEFSLCINN